MSKSESNRVEGESLTRPDMEGVAGSAQLQNSTKCNWGELCDMLVSVSNNRLMYTCSMCFLAVKQHPNSGTGESVQKEFGKG